MRVQSLLAERFQLRLRVSRVNRPSTRWWSARVAEAEGVT
jgi:hypothetical protein